MATKYNSLEELRRKKELLKKEVSEMEDLFKFENKKESLSAFTNGFTDRYIEEQPTEDGNSKLAIRTGVIAKEIGNSLTKKSTQKSIVNFNNDGLKESLLENTLKLGSVAFMGNLAKKNLNKTSWKNKAIGLAIVYLLPIALRFLRTRLEDYQKNKSVSSLEKLI